MQINNKDDLRQRILIEKRRTSAWVKILVIGIFEVVPAFFLWLLLSPDLSKTTRFTYIYTIYAVLAFFAWVLIILTLFLWWKIIWYDTLSLAIPIAITFMGILATYPLPSWSRALIIILLAITAYPANMFSQFLIEKVIRKQIKFKNKNI